MEAQTKIDLIDAWREPLENEFAAPYMQQLRAFLKTEKANGKIIYPKSKEIFQALNTTPLDQVKVVILGQDPYHGPGQAHGLSFSVPAGIQSPPSLLNIFAELKQDLQVNNVRTGNLLPWAQQGVLLLNSVLTVEQGLAASHQGKGWEQFTDQIIQLVNTHTEHTVFLLWGKYAQVKGSQIDRSRHLVLMAPHPSPLSAYRGFIGCRHFSQANRYLEQHGKTPINWQL
jgi:uracil-DNA glycosylase